jgi:nucleotide-binding universal stress UspA family protein
MEIARKSIFVPWDYTEKANCAFEHAFNLSKTFTKEIVLLNVVDKEKYVNDAIPKLKSEAERLQSEFNINVKYIVAAGKLFKTIPAVAKEKDAALIVMGMHSSKRSIKTVMGSKVPFFLVQEKPKRDHIVEVVVPIDTDDKNRVQLNWVIYIAKHFNCNINIIKPFIKKDSKNRKMKANMFFARRALDAKNVVYGIRTAKREDKWNHAVSKFANELDSDLIFVMSHDFKKFMKSMEGENLKIPIICINPATDLKLLPGKFA